MKNLLLIVWLLCSVQAHAQWYYGSGEATNLENIIGFDKNGQKIITGSNIDPTATATAGGIGSVYLRNNGALYIKKDNGVSTNWNDLEDTIHKDQANGYAGLDAMGKLPVTVMPNAIMLYKGDWNPATNMPTLGDATGTAGWLYRATATGTPIGFADPSMTGFQVGDFAIYSGTVWQRAPSADGVISVDGLQGAVTLPKGNITESTSNVLTIGNGINAVFGSGTTLQVNQASTATSGYLSFTDWNTFNNKQNTVSTGTLSSGSPITITGGVGALFSNASVDIPLATTATDGYLSATDWNIFNNKIGSVSTGTLSASSPINVTGGVASLLSPASLTIDKATTATAGYLSSVDWNIFNNKEPSFVKGNINGTANRLSVANGNGVLVSASATLNIDTNLLPSPLAGDVGKALLATGANAATWTTLPGVSSATMSGTAPIVVTGGVGSVLSTVSVAVNSGDLAANAPITVAGGTSKLLGSTATLSLTTGSLNASAPLNIAGGSNKLVSSDATLTLTTGNLVANAPMSVAGGSNALVGNATVTMTKSTESVDGYLSAADHVVHNNNKNILVLYPEKMSAAYVASGNNAVFDGGGSLGGSATLSLTSADLLIGTAAIKYVAAGNNSNDYIVVNSFTIPAGLKGSTVSFDFQYKATVAGMKFAVKINGGALDTVVQTMDLDAASSAKPAQLLFNIPSDATSLEFGFFNSSTVAIAALFDRISLGADPFGKANLYTQETWWLKESGSGLLDRSGEIRFSTTSITNVSKDGVTSNTAATQATSNLIYTLDDAGNSRTKFVATKNCRVSIHVNIQNTAVQSSALILKNGAEYTGGTYSPAVNTRVGTSATMFMAPGDYFTVGTQDSVYNDGNDRVWLSYTAISESPAITVKGRTNAAQLWGTLKYFWNGASANWYSTSASWVGFGVGTNVSSAVVTGNATAPATKIMGVVYPYLPAGTYQFTAFMDAQLPSGIYHGFRFHDGTTAFGQWNGYVTTQGNWGSISGSITYDTDQYNKTFQIQGYSQSGTQNIYIVSAMEEFRIETFYYPSPGSQFTTVALPASKVNDFAVRVANSGTPAITTQGPTQVIQSVVLNGTGTIDYTFVPGMFTVAPSVVASANRDSGDSVYIVVQNVTTSGFRTVTTNSTPAANNYNVNVSIHRQGTDAFDSGKVYVGNVAKTQVCVVSHTIANGTNGGTFTAGSWQTKPLNTISGDTSFCSVSSNQFTLIPGGYSLVAFSPSLSVDSNKAKLYNVTDAVDAIIGDNQYSQHTVAMMTSSVIVGKFEITSSKTYEIRHLGSFTQATNGFGVAATNGTNEVYTQVFIEKLY